MKESLLKLFETIGFFNVDPQETSDFQITNRPIQEGEYVIGAMNEFEKSCMVFLEMKNKEDDDLHKQMDELDESSEAFKKLYHKHYLLIESFEIVNRMMWASVNTRLKDAELASGVGFRDGNKVVAGVKSDEDEEEDDTSPFAMPGIGIMILGVKEKE